MSVENDNAVHAKDRILISVVIPALNEERVIAKCLSSLTQQELPSSDFEVIVVDNGSTDRTVEVARSFGASLNLKVLQKPNSHISALRNLGAKTASAPLLAFLDSDCLARPNWLRLAVEILQNGNAGVVGAHYTVPEDSSWVGRGWYGDMAAMKQGRVTYVPSGTLFMRRDLYFEVGGFDENIQTSEDFELCQRVQASGHDVLAYPELSTIHLGTPQTLGLFYRKQKWHGSGVRTAFLRNTFDRAFAKTVVLTLYWLFGLMVTVAGIPLGIALRNWPLMLVGPAFLAAGSLLLAVRATAERKKWGLVVPLAVLYMTYGVARSMSLLGFGKKRSSAPSRTAGLNSCVG